ncbi:MAG: FHA domain-containing protein [Dysosmobacter sp.]
MSGGNSGGPLVDGDGAVLGINTAASNLDQNLFYAVSISEILPILDRNNITYAMYERVRPPTSCSTAPSAQRGRGVGGRDGGGLRLQEAEEGRRTAGSASDAGAARPVRCQPVIRSMSTQHGGMTVQLHHQPIQVGRDNATCRLVFRRAPPASAPITARSTLTSRQGMFVVTDLGSTYGTFLAGGQRIAPESPVKLPPKSSIYLGEPDNTLYLDLE